MYKEIYIYLIVIFLKLIQCKEECQWFPDYTYETKADVNFLFGAEMKKDNGLVIDVNYEDRGNDRIFLTSKTKNSTIFILVENEYNETNINSHLDDGFHDMFVFVVNNTLLVESTSSNMVPVNISLHSRIKSIKVSATNIKICEESCIIEKSIKKSITIEDTFRLTAFTTSTNPITFNISDSVKGEVLGHFEVKPSDCIYKWKQENMTIPCEHINQGWNKFNIYINKTEITINNFIIIPIDNNSKTISISGSYLVNCAKGNPLWIISKEEISIPIYLDQEIVFILDSAVEFSPTLNLNGNNLTLNWDNGLSFGSFGKPLQPRSYNISFEETSNMLKIYEKHKGDFLVALKIGKSTEYIRVSSFAGDFQLSISLEEPFGQKENTLTTGTSSIANTSTSSTVGHTPTVVTILIIGIEVAGAVVFIWRKKELLIIQLLLALGSLQITTSAIITAVRTAEAEDVFVSSTSRIVDNIKNNDISME